MRSALLGQTLLIFAIWLVHSDAKITKRFAPPCNKNDGCVYNEQYMTDTVRMSPSLQDGLTTAEKTFLLHEHNRLRRRQAKGEIPNLPGASDMTEMIWDEQLSIDAQKWVENCHAEHGGHDGEGQSYAEWQDPKGALEYAVNGWFLSEYPLWSYGSPPGAAGHYTQMVTAFSTKVGCGYKSCPNEGGLVFCHYFFAGNLYGKNPFTEGPACSKCPDKYGYCDDGLCATHEICQHRKKCQCIVDQATCSANGKFDASTCECTCNEGWRGASCSEPCEDDPDKFCDQRPQDYCDPKHEFFLDTVIFCPTVCGQCKASAKAKGPCADTDADCAEWASDGECDNNPDWMMENCGVSCGACEGKKRHSSNKAHKKNYWQNH